MRRGGVALLLLLLLLLLAGCGRGGEAVPVGNGSAGDRLEAAAVSAGLVVDPARRSLVGSWGRDTDRACIVPGSADSGGGAMRIGVLIDYGAGQGCAARGTVDRHGDRLAITLGDCRFDARFDGERIVFPADVPAACDRLCTGRATLAAVEVDRLSASASEARTLQAVEGTPLCAP